MKENWIPDQVRNDDMEASVVFHYETPLEVGNPEDLKPGRSQISLQEKTMPHVIVKMYPGRSKEQKIKLADEIVKDVVAIAGCKERSVSVAIEEIAKEDWDEKVYRPDILNKKTILYRKPDYNPFEGQ